MRVTFSREMRDTSNIVNQILRESFHQYQYYIILEALCFSRLFYLKNLSLMFAFKNAASRSNANKKCVAPTNTETLRFVDEFRPICIADRSLAPYFRLARIKAKKYGNVPRLFRLVSLHNGASVGGVLYMLLFRYTHLPSTSTYFRNIHCCFLPNRLKIFAEIVEPRIGYRNTTC